MMERIHIRVLHLGHYRSICGQSGGAISEKHYMDSILKPVVRAHVKSLNMCRECVGAIEQRWTETLKYQRENACRKK